MPKFMGDGGDYTLAITTATATAIPATANVPDGSYELIISNVSDSTVYFRITTGTTAGIAIVATDMLSIDFSQGQSGFVYQSSGSTKTINYTVKEIQPI